jgi:hypothetical protein
VAVKKSGVFFLVLVTLGVSVVLWELLDEGAPEKVLGTQVAAAEAHALCERSEMSVPRPGARASSDALPDAAEATREPEALAGQRPGSAALRFEIDGCYEGNPPWVEVRPTQLGEERPAQKFKADPAVLAELEPGEYAITPPSGGWVAEPSSVWLNAYDTATIRLTPPYRVSGQVVDALTGLPIPDATVGILRKFDVDGSSRSGYDGTEPKTKTADGLFCKSSRFSGTMTVGGVVAEASFAVLANAEGYLPGRTDWFLQASGPEWNDLVVPLGPALDVSGFILDGDTGEPMRGVKLKFDPTIESLSERDLNRLESWAEDGGLIREVFSESDGAFHLRRSLREGAGEFVLTAEHSGYLPYALPLTVTEAGPVSEVVVMM